MSVGWNECNKRWRDTAKAAAYTKVNQEKEKELTQGPALLRPAAQVTPTL